MDLRKLTLFAAAGASALALAACREDDRRARYDVPEPAPLALAYEEALPYAPPAPVEYYEPARGYEWAERAYAQQAAFYDEAPDYAFDYGGIEPYAWRTADDWAMYAEPWDDGYRYYYYEPGSAYPYFVRDDDYGYGFDGAGLLIAVFDSDGRYLPQDRFVSFAPAAGRYYAHGRDLRNAALAAPRIEVREDVWRAAAPRIERTAQPWLRAARTQDGWREWRERAGGRRQIRFERAERRDAAPRESGPVFREARRHDQPPHVGAPRREAVREVREARRELRRGPPEARFAEAQGRQAAAQEPPHVRIERDRPHAEHRAGAPDRRSGRAAAGPEPGPQGGAPPERGPKAAAGPKPERGPRGDGGGEGHGHGHGKKG